ncbi:hypothetical protein S7711_10466 [Stachybotrys chartarum IBT 7711]|uniref:Uncharacterized protein n=1 Tax=Stachybotrys chartarum (strain CBS 109288 / IBT 7711) TaxID=1280523 RepID=A0A084B739_STACB|nr:hypothetical protein S7711_10466 [Stachybotrys chartarum IBT 7711]KFA55121.1 hypothetical protein S40293_10705 [Stachybotrys chartarum IBT 40293]KFA81636.1 hypothetical protein S40288_11276 [Stachybotrys chartarum IBT 40288]
MHNVRCRLNGRRRFASPPCTSRQRRLSKHRFLDVELAPIYPVPPSQIPDGPTNTSQPSRPDHAAPPRRPAQAPRRRQRRRAHAHARVRPVVRLQLAWVFEQPPAAVLPLDGVAAAHPQRRRHGRQTHGHEAARARRHEQPLGKGRALDAGAQPRDDVVDAGDADAGDGARCHGAREDVCGEDGVG